MDQPPPSPTGAHGPDDSTLPETAPDAVPGLSCQAPVAELIPATLQIAEGGGTVRSVPLGRGPVRIGRSAASDVVLADSGVSRTHAEVLYDEGGYLIRDLGSSNGTYVDGVRTGTARLRPGATIELGHAVIGFLHPPPEVSDAERLALMRRSDLLRALDPPLLASAAQLMSVRHVPAGGVLLRQGTPLPGIILVGQGALRMVEVNDEGGERVVGRVERGGHFGERALVTPISAPQTLVADEDACVLELTSAALDGLMARRPEDSGEVAGAVWKRIRTEQRRRPAADRPRSDDLAGILAPPAVEIIGEDKRLLRAKERLESLAAEPGPILIAGPRGSGKHLFARHFHNSGPRRADPYVEISLADPATGDHGQAIFGHETGPDDSPKGRTGLLEVIGQGTLTITHADLLRPDLQVRLAGYLQHGWFHRIHGRERVTSRTQVVLIATGDEAEVLDNLVPELQAIVEKRVVVSLALSQRVKDIPLLAEHYLRLNAARSGRPAPPLSREAVERLVSYGWPGNVRELANVIQRAVMIATQANIIPGDLIFVSPPEKELHTRNLLRNDRIRDLLRRPRLMPTFIWINLVFVAFVTAFTLYGGTRPAGHPLAAFATNPGMLVTWLIWFPLLPISAFLVGRIWCGVCPIAGFGDLAARVTRFNLPVPAILKRLDFWLLAGTFVFVDYVEELLGVARGPWATAIFLIVILYIAAAMTILYERKAFCRYVCPIAGVLGAYSAMSIFEIRGNRKVCQSQCGDHTCHKGTAEVEGCPLFAYPASINTNAECMMCLNCVRTCDNRGLQLNLRPPLREIWRNREPMLAMSVFAVVLVGLMVKHQFHGLTLWLIIQQRLGWTDAAAHTVLYITFAMLALVPFLISSAVSAAASRERVAANAAAYGIAFLPLAFSGHLAHLTWEFLTEGIYELVTYVVKLWNWAVGAVPVASSAYSVTPFISPAVVTFVVFLVVLGGLVASMIALAMIARRRAAEGAGGGAVPHMVLLAAMWVGYVSVFLGTMGPPMR